MKWNWGLFVATNVLIPELELEEEEKPSKHKEDDVRIYAVDEYEESRQRNEKDLTNK